MPEAITSQRMMPPKMFTRMAFTCREKVQNEVSCGAWRPPLQLALCSRESFVWHVTSAERHAHNVKLLLICLPHTFLKTPILIEIAEPPHCVLTTDLGIRGEDLEGGHHLQGEEAVQRPVGKGAAGRVSRAGAVTDGPRHRAVEVRPPA